jgi:hypothetical protein
MPVTLVKFILYAARLGKGFAPSRFFQHPRLRELWGTLSCMRGALSPLETLAGVGVGTVVAVEQRLWIDGLGWVGLGWVQERATFKHCL